MKTNRILRPGEQLFTLMLLTCSIVILIMAYKISGFSSASSPGAFPMAAALIMVVAIASILRANQKLEKPATSTVLEELRLARQRVLPKTFILYAAIIISYMLLLRPLHFIPSSFLFLLISIVLLRGSGLLRSLLISLGTIGAIYFIFQYLFRVVLP